jgi:hypothetical protein
MKFSAAFVAAVMTTLASTGSATVFQGIRTAADGSQAQVAWYVTHQLVYLYNCQAMTWECNRH